jgi:hypothetical protein
MFKKGGTLIKYELSRVDLIGKAFGERKLLEMTRPEGNVVSNFLILVRITLRNLLICKEREM